MITNKDLEEKLYNDSCCIFDKVKQEVSLIKLSDYAANIITAIKEGYDVSKHISNVNSYIAMLEIEQQNAFINLIKNKIRYNKDIEKNLKGGQNEMGII